MSPPPRPELGYGTEPELAAGQRIPDLKAASWLLVRPPPQAGKLAAGMRVAPVLEEFHATTIRLTTDLLRWALAEAGEST